MVAFINKCPRCGEDITPQSNKDTKLSTEGFGFHLGNDKMSCYQVPSDTVTSLSYHLFCNSCNNFSYGFDTDELLNIHKINHIRVFCDPYTIAVSYKNKSSYVKYKHSRKNILKIPRAIKFNLDAPDEEIISKIKKYLVFM